MFGAINCTRRISKLNKNKRKVLTDTTLQAPFRRSSERRVFLSGASRTCATGWTRSSCPSTRWGLSEIIQSEVKHNLAADSCFLSPAKLGQVSRQGSITVYSVCSGFIQCPVPAVKMSAVMSNRSAAFISSIFSSLAFISTIHDPLNSQNAICRPPSSRTVLPATAWRGWRLGTWPPWGSARPVTN